MKIVIDIPEENYERLKSVEEMGGIDNPYLKAIANGTPLPKGLIPINDAMSVFDDFMCGDVDEDGMETFYEMLKERVIEADEEGAEE